MVAQMLEVLETSTQLSSLQKETAVVIINSLPEAIAEQSILEIENGTCIIIDVTGLDGVLHELDITEDSVLVYVHKNDEPEEYKASLNNYDLDVITAILT